jgi:hypothetical protein
MAEVREESFFGPRKLGTQSTAEWVIRVLAFLPTQNETAISLGGDETFMLLPEILKKLPDERTPGEDEVLRSLARSACKKVIMKADAISTTTTSSMNPWTRKFVKSRSTTTIIDQAYACVLAEANIA